MDIAEGLIREAIKNESCNLMYHYTLATILGSMGKWTDSLSASHKFLRDEAFVHSEIAEISNYFVNVAANGYAADAIQVLEQYKNIPVLEPILAGLRIYLGENILIAQEIKEIGHDVAELIKETAKKKDSST